MKLWTKGKIVEEVTGLSLNETSTCRYYLQALFVKFSYSPSPTFLILGTLMQHVILCQMENRVFFYSVISELGDASNINRSQVVTTWRQNEV
jgi:hypothetical protein